MLTWAMVYAATHGVVVSNIPIALALLGDVSMAWAVASAIKGRRC